MGRAASLVVANVSLAWLWRKREPLLQGAPLAPLCKCARQSSPRAVAARRPSPQPPHSHWALAKPWFWDALSLEVDCEAALAMVAGPEAKALKEAKPLASSLRESAGGVRASRDGGWFSLERSAWTAAGGGLSAAACGEAGQRGCSRCCKVVCAQSQRRLTHRGMRPPQTCAERAAAQRG